MKLMVLDGNSILNRSYYGIRPLTTKDGFYTQAIYGFRVTMARLEDEERPDAVCVTFDRREPTFRHLEYEGYKAQRDVYKRQELYAGHCGSARFHEHLPSDRVGKSGRALQADDAAKPVSYTHLDVYKRQVRHVAPGDQQPRG